ncbi:unnamed protein product [Dracunculus medinensis]|uniref:Signal peptidase complex subunit 3 n=1 Tax=Dracunculus medinensis TaxID=318479 RepID=A0A0N4U1Y6_DRAME|nr:unnamed protein product [Dracunculus medinensis]
MHTIWSRANAVFACMLTVLSAMTFCVFISTVFLKNSTSVVISGNNVRVKNVVDYAADQVGARSDVAMAELSIDVDLTPIFNWNVKQIFLLLVAEYSTSKNAVNQVRAF